MRFTGQIMKLLNGINSREDISRLDEIHSDIENARSMLG
jgi:hypothetical protein